jgi:hypothetical protein
VRSAVIRMILTISPKITNERVKVNGKIRPIDLLILPLTLSLNSIIRTEAPMQNTGSNGTQ